MFLIWSKVLKKYFQNRKWNNSNWKWNYFFNFQASDQKTSFSTSFSYVPRGSKLSFKTGNGIIQTGNGIISPTFGPLIKKVLLQDVFFFIFTKEIKIIRTGNVIIFPISRPLIKTFLFSASSSKLIWKQKMELSNQEMELIFPLPDLRSKIFFYKTFFSFLPGKLNRKLYWHTFSSVQLFWAICTYLDISWPNWISSQPMQDPTCFYSNLQIGLRLCWMFSSKKIAILWQTMIIVPPWPN